MLEQIKQYRPLIEAALEYSNGTHNFTDIAKGIMEKRYQLWAMPNSCMITEFHNFPRKRVAHVFLAAGDISELAPAAERFIEFAKANQCVRVTVSGRKGWEKVLEYVGITDKTVILGKDL